MIVTSLVVWELVHGSLLSVNLIFPPSIKECNYGIRASQTSSILTKSKVNSIYTYNFK
jgi:hypothetical protein